MNVAVINIKDLLKLAVRFILLILIFIIPILLFKNVKINVGEKVYTSCINEYLSAFKYFNEGESSKRTLTVASILDRELRMVKCRKYKLWKFR